MLKGVRANQNPQQSCIVASGKMVKGGGGVQIEIQKTPGIYFYSGLRKNVQGGGGGAIRNPRYNPSIYFDRWLQENLSRGGGCNMKS